MFSRAEEVHERLMVAADVLRGSVPVARALGLLQGRVNTGARLIASGGTRIAHPSAEKLFAVTTQGKSPVRWFRTPGSVEGAASNDRPYSDRQPPVPHRPWLLPLDIGGSVTPGPLLALN
jgi:hypothetical protein